MAVITDTDIQWKYKNNDLREAYFVGGEVLAHDDDTSAGSTFIVCGLPKHCIIGRVMVYTQNASAISAVVKSQDDDTLVNVVPEVDAGTEIGLATVIVDKALPEATNVVVTFNDDFTRGRVLVLVEIIEVDKLGNGGVPNVLLPAE